ncbi:MAG: hypothetical protein AB1401_06875 [Thermodesulfobacteriota bacterium]
MNRLSPEQEERKKAVFDGMSARNKKKILARGYGRWDPFLDPKDPIDMRVSQGRHAAWELAKNFLQTCSHEDYSNEYGQGVWEICTGIISGKDRYRAMYEFSCWYQRLLKNGKL